jgi:hypothetical protein
MDNSRWLRYKERHQPHIVGRFKNQFGERFVIYRNKNGVTPYITGDELDWELRVPLLWNNTSFMLDAEERDEIARILWPVFGDPNVPEFAGWLQENGKPTDPSKDEIPDLWKEWQDFKYDF